jgi:hypothetical protein
MLMLVKMGRRDLLIALEFDKIEQGIEKLAVLVQRLNPKDG